MRKIIALLTILTLCIGVTGCSSKNTGKETKDIPVPVQTEKPVSTEEPTEKAVESTETKHTENGLTVYDYNMGIQSTMTEDGLVEFGIKKSENSVSELVEVINEGFNDGRRLIDSASQLLQYFDDENNLVYFIDITAFKSVNEFLPYLIDEKPIRFDPDFSNYVDENRRLGRLLCETKDFYIGYEKISEDNEYRIFGIWNGDFNKRWFFLDTTLQERITEWDDIVAEE